MEPSTTPGSALRFDSRAAARTGALVAILTLCLLWLWAAIVWAIATAPGATATELDFRVFWGAARLAAAGEAAAAFDMARLAEAHGGDPETWLPWVYPPGLMLAIWPLGLLDFPVAWAVWVGLSLLAMLAAVWLYAGDFRPFWLAFALSPALLPALVLGQVAVLWAAGLVAALAFLRDGRAVAAGVMLGLLSFKPQLGLLAALAMVAAGNWRVVVAAGVTTILLHGLATLAFGLSYWPAFLDMATQHAERLRTAVAEAELMVSLYSALTATGVPERLALGLQWTLAAAAAVAVWAAWARPGLPFDLRAAVLATAIPLASPYLWYPETALLAPALLFMVRAGLIVARPAGLALAALMTAGVTPWLMARILLADETLPMRLFAAPVLIAAFLVTATPLKRQGAPRGTGP